jgi:hypothetical protein
MISQKIIEHLKKNWGEKADSLNCYAEVKLIDLLSSWCCYIFAMDESEEIIQCLIYSNMFGAVIETQRMDYILSMYNKNGEHPWIDREYRRMKVTELLKRLRHDT